ncbi:MULTISPECIES: pilus assembly protein PilM [unclassified Exiguobacterium]|uniref:pilus assembly protein PilM n=1 Tax=unclassified Exiguobacterium TaxID=2644629 RepID=UPI00103AA0E8|nr:MULTISPECIES: pilus assembly protein PilM [unclassified Exiguobacterium]TCI37577.1 fimbrial assembly protein [Exiguobacterium sp. SH4S7]TCI45909.1 fimbrial assembly protein [Exiguobacterium sp. SH5S32]TCI51666.1 fimbrial assembly protein [Exiguobacterium sp. SH1S4]TCI65684.1 fimbrial assembly protein [Exiguobacterium sp. SH0S2]TCI71652.1 fimbrial assembly protein [Exiguobacterium sp. SH1S1]
MSRAIEKGTVAYFSFDALSIHGAVIKQGVFKRSASVQLAKGAYAEGLIQDENAFGLAFDELCRKIKVRKGMVCAVDMAETEVLSRKVEIPSNIPKDEIRGYLFMEIGSSIILPFDDVAFDYEVLGETDMKTEVMLHAVSVDLTKAIRAYMKKRGFALKKIVPRPIAIANGVSRLETLDPLKSTLLWHVTPFAHQLLVLEEGQVRFIRAIENDLSYRADTTDGIVTYTFNGSNEALANRTDEWLNELARFLDFYRYSLRTDGRPIDELIISGTVPELDDLVRTIELESMVPIKRIDDPLPLSHATPLTHQMLPLLGMATLDRDHDANFINATDVTLRWPIVASLAALLIGGGLTGYLYYEVNGIEQDKAQVNEQLQLVRIYQTEQVNSKGQQVISLEQTVTALTTEEKQAVPALRALTEQLPPTGYVLTYNYADGSLMSVRTQFETLPDLNAFQRALLNDPRFDNVKLLGVTTETKAEADQDAETDTGTPVLNASDEPLPRYIGEFTFTFIDAEPETPEGETEQPEEDEEVVSE